jgi:tRNA U54 and U55 pseudouridine synthase Pus10
MLEDMLDVNESDARKLAIDHDKIEQALTGDRNLSIISFSCELGVRYPMLKAMLNRKGLHIRVSVSPLIMSGIYKKSRRHITHLYVVIPGVFNRNCVLHCDSASALRGVMELHPWMSCC